MRHGISDVVDYARLTFVEQQHAVRYRRYVEAHGLVCQACGGRGGSVEDRICDFGGPRVPCGYCEGTGRMTRWMRGRWLRWRREERRRAD